ncbi:ABC transporter substrate-binding protein [Microbacterium marinilacus]|uniref:Solute-binding protein family 3/N-terminal domain-containing protein n=1 Tax=Microbacterium marinilacus TaxID=415209 RepID=A0ABP7BCN3_9MICO|nr:ABC transporter substrate-binding protein [Microbacterium marinilacus]MBY0687079.1 ABC transporter substrate-binding protein [Microbacterium marinilacus]
MSRTRIFSAAALATVGVLSLAACSSGSPSGPAETETAPAAEGGGDLTPITVGLLAIAPAAAVQYGIDEGIFEEHGLDVTVQMAQGGAAMLPAVSTGQYDFGVGNPLSVLTAASQGVDVRIASGYSFSLAEGDDINAVVARAGEGIESWSDLEGKKVSVNAVKTQGDLTIDEAVEQDGGDPSAVEYIEVAFPDALAQLDGGNVDAVWIPEPFLSAALADPDTYTVVGHPNQETIPGLPTMVTFTSGAVGEDAELLEAWRGAVSETLAAATEDREGFGQTISEFTGMPEAAAADLRLERLDAELDPQLIADLSDLAQKFEFLTSAPDLETVILD